MKASNLFSVILIGFAWSILSNTGTAVQASAPNQAPTAEPTKAPYVFPTPIFIPTFASYTEPPSSPAGTSAAKQPAVPAAIERTYTVVQGDNPWTIARKMYGRGDRFPLILQANGLTESSVLRVGTVLRIPPPDTVVQVAPTPAPTTAATKSAPELTALVQPTVVVPTRAPTPVPSQVKEAASLTGMLSTAATILSLVLLLAAIATGLLAFLVYKRSSRLDRITTRLRRLKTDKP